MFGAYAMDLSLATDALFDPAVWQQPRVLLEFLLGPGAASKLTGVAEPSQELSVATLIVWEVRLPRILIALFVGMNLAVSGAIFQGVTRNELASPFILGVSSGAGLAILLVLVVFQAYILYLPILAAIGGVAAFLLVYTIAWKDGTSPVRLVLAGVIVGTLCGSIQRALFYISPDLMTMQSAMEWTAGSLTGVGWPQVRLALPWTLLSMVLALAGSRQLDLMLLGDRRARALGMSVERVRFALSGVAILAAATAISVSGLVGFVGLIIPHIVRNSLGGSNRSLLLGCLIAGPALLVVSDTFARLVLSPTQVPVGIVTGLLGGPYFLYLMRKRREIGEV